MGLGLTLGLCKDTKAWKQHGHDRVPPAKHLLLQSFRHAVRECNEKTVHVEYVFCAMYVLNDTGSTL